MTTAEPAIGHVGRQVPTPDNNLNDQHPVGYGRMLRKEDQRLLRGRGQFVDDITVPGMLHLAILRSPYAHARIVSIDTSAAVAHPRVKAVVTGEDLAAHNLAWMPSLSNDVQACWPPTRSASSIRRWRSWWPRTATRPVTPWS
jgi:CO/xanthine dehydrogenase Mo-binding subunit